MPSYDPEDPAQDSVDISNPLNLKQREKKKGQCGIFDYCLTSEMTRRRLSLSHSIPSRRL